MVAGAAGRSRHRVAYGTLLVGSGLALCFVVVAACDSGSSDAGSPRPTAASPPAAGPSTGSGNAAGGNVWSASVDPSRLPLGDGKVSDAPRRGYVYSCTTAFRGGGARHAGDWLDAAAGTWDMTAKPAVQGAVAWPAADYGVSVSGGTRTIATNDLPEQERTGIFPIAPTDPVYRYDTNPNRIAADPVTLRLPAEPQAAATASCTGLGPVGVLDDGVFLYNALDAAGRDAVAHETQDRCNGHPDGHEHYHYHDVPVCIRDRATGTATLVGYALDGYGIYVERDAAGNLPTDADLDACHGRTSTVPWDGAPTRIYHYDATLEYPYTVGCFHGTPVRMPRG